MAKEQVSLRLDADVLAEISKLAEREGWSRTQFVEKALRFFVATDGGRTLQGGITPPGLTPAFVEWLKGLETPARVAILVAGGNGPPIRYTGVMEPPDVKATLADGLLALRIKVEAIDDSVMIRLPRGVIIGWTEYTSDFESNKQVALGLEQSGNARLESLFATPRMESK